MYCGGQRNTAFRLREKADYDDFFIVSHEAAEEQAERAEKVIEMVAPYLKEKWAD